MYQPQANIGGKYDKIIVRWHHQKNVYKQADCHCKLEGFANIERLHNLSGLLSTHVPKSLPDKNQVGDQKYTQTC